MRTSWRWRTLGALGGLGLMVAMAGCGNSDDTQSADEPSADEPVTITVWDTFSTPNAKPGVDKIIEQFEAEHPNVTVEREVFNPDDLKSTARTALAGGRGPDVLYYDVGPANAELLIKADLLAPMSDVPGVEPDQLLSPWGVDQGAFEGESYGLPQEADLLGMFYNDELMDELGLTPPETMDDFIPFCEKAKAAGYVPIAIADQEGWEAYHQFAMLANNALGQEATRNLLLDNEGNWDTDEMTQALQTWFIDMNEAGCFPDHVTGTTYENGFALFKGGKAVAAANGAWFADELDGLPNADQITFTRFPQIGDQDPVYPATAGSAWYVTKSGAENGDAVSEFLNYLYSPDATQMWVEEVGAVPASTSEVDASSVGPVTGQVISNLQAGLSGSDSPLGYFVDTTAPPEFVEQVGSGFQQMFTGDLSAEDQIAKLQEIWDQTATS